MSLSPGLGKCTLYRCLCFKGSGSPVETSRLLHEGGPGQCGWGGGVSNGKRRSYEIWGGLQILLFSSRGSMKQLHQVCTIGRSLRRSTIEPLIFRRKGWGLQKVFDPLRMKIFPSRGDGGGLHEIKKWISVKQSNTFTRYLTQYSYWCKHLRLTLRLLSSLI